MMGEVARRIEPEKRYFEFQVLETLPHCACDSHWSAAGSPFREEPVRELGDGAHALTCHPATIG